MIVQVKGILVGSEIESYKKKDGSEVNYRVIGLSQSGSMRTSIIRSSVAFEPKADKDGVINLSLVVPDEVWRNGVKTSAMPLTVLE